MFCFFRGDKLVSRVWFVSAAIAHHGFDYARCLVECRLDAPKTPTGENGGFCAAWGGALPKTCRRKCQAAKNEKTNSIHTVSFMSLRTRRSSRCFTSRVCPTRSVAECELRCSGRLGLRKGEGEGEGSFNRFRHLR